MTCKDKASYGSSPPCSVHSIVFSVLKNEKENFLEVKSVEISVLI